VIHSLPVRLAAILLALSGFSAGATAADIKLLTTGAFKPIAMDIVPGFQKQTGHRVDVDNDTAGGIVHRLNSGEAFDVVVLTQGELQKMIGAGKILDSSVVPLIRTSIGAAVRLDAPRPDFSTVESFRSTLLAAKAVAYVDPASGGTTGIYLEQLFQRLGIMAEIDKKAVKVKGGLAAEQVANGKADLALQPYSEILRVTGVQHVGLIPEAAQLHTIYSGAVGARSAVKEAGLSLLAAFSDPAVAPLLKKHGVEKP
jgi:molybdate transport system substrate-binding protein